MGKILVIGWGLREWVVIRGIGLYEYELGLRYICYFCENNFSCCLFVDKVSVL